MLHPALRRQTQFISQGMMSHLWLKSLVRDPHTIEEFRAAEGRDKKNALLTVHAPAVFLSKMPGSSHGNFMLTSHWLERNHKPQLAARGNGKCSLSLQPAF